MAQKLYLRAVSGTPTVGTDQTRQATTDPGVAALASATLLTMATVAGPTAPLQYTNGGTPITWISPAVAVAITISGTITINLRGKVSAAAANATLEASVVHLDSSGNVLSTIAAVPPAAIPAAMGPSDAAVSYTVTPTSTSLAVGDHIGIRVYIDDGNGVNMAAGQTVTLSLDANNATAGQGDSWVQFTETVQYLLSGTLETPPPADIVATPGASGQTWAATTNLITATGINPAQS